MSELYNLAYISKNEMQGTQEEVKTEIEAILKKAHVNNPSKNITGALLYSGGYFCQVIEGAQEDLEELFETISFDDRHGDITVLHFEPAQERLFTDWSMALAGIEENMRFDIEGVKASKNELVLKETGKNLISSLDELVRQHQQIL